MSETDTLEQRIMAVLNDPNSASSDEISVLIVDADSAINTAEQEIVAARELAQDITKTPLPVQAADARRAAEAAALARDRLTKIQPTLRERYTASLATERREKWRGFYEIVAAEREPLAIEFDETFARIRAELVALNAKIREFNGEASYVNRMGGEMGQWGYQLDSLPLIAQLRTVDTDSARSEPDWRAANSFAASFAQSMAFPSHPGANWADQNVQQQRREQIERYQKALADYYIRTRAEAEALANTQEKQRFEASRKAI